ncbi:exodeoxyribonuclease V subunit gamma [Ramlibacter humi]|uniref:RecBCD enzyme subunit RecC n=1 Tax=Ramlibacter humi TaxID=2530451 RepID=A0A4Z0BHI2_9BURK|nr:exodeoxyribonuclease V subunit gamma [Ramlibacter humi]TFY97574.1 exodeoxyribonuclease V subunit gamma [Ramlibacter humi]
MLHLHFSNRLERLTDQLLQALAGERTDVFEPETVVVPHTAAKRHLQLALAQRDGICANVAFVYLAQWLWAQVARVQPGISAESPLQSGPLAWRLFALFQDPAFTAAHPVLDAYLAAGEDDPVFAWELAARAAPVLEQYATYRPAWLEAWQRGERVTAALHESWQADAWRRIAVGLGLREEHPMRAIARELESADLLVASELALPRTVHLFALPSIPPLYLGALQALSRHVDIHIYSPSPSAEYWFDLVDPRRLDKLRAAGRAEGFEVGHRLLTSWGQQSQSSLDQLARLDESDRTRWVSDYQASGKDTLLGRLQDSMLELQDLEPGTVAIDEGDRSLEVHVCHSLTRELEVLHDQLLARFAADPTLKPSDIAVVTPDLEAAAPLVDAVFGTAPPARHIPYALTGRARSGVNAAAKAFLELLALAASRCTATEVFSLLQQPVVRRRFGLDDEGVQQVHEWMLASGIHWGLDAQHVAAQQLPPGTAHTLADGLARLFLGHALPEGAAQPLAGTLPMASIEGSGAAALGAFWQYVRRLRQLARELERPRPAERWAALLRQAAADFMVVGREEADELVELLAAIDAVAADAALAAHEGEVHASVMRAALEAQLGDASHGGTPTGRVTFTGMSGLRHLPFRVVCVVGLNDGAFPATDGPPEFDLLPLAPRPGDRQRRTDQRNLLLDLLLSARDAFHVSYTGRSIRDNSVLPPSVLLSELLDVLVPATAADPSSADSLRQAEKRLVVEHPLQPFSAEAFDPEGDPRRRSFDAELAAALRAATTHAPADIAPAAPAFDDEDEDAVAEPARRFFPQALAAPGPEWREVPLARLAEFFRHPARYLLRRRLGVELLRDEPELQDDEPFLPDYDGRSRLAQRLLPHLLSGASEEDAARLAAAGVELPAGALGESERQVELASLSRFAAAVRKLAPGAPLPSQSLSAEVEVDGETWRIEGAFADLRPSGRVAWRYDDERAGDVLTAWIPHLLLCAAEPAGVEPRTAWVARGACTVYDRVEAWQARERLRELVALYARGLSEPLPFFAKSSWELVRTGKPQDARRKWQGSEAFPGEGAHPANALVWRGVVDPLDDEFVRVAQAVLGELPARQVPLSDLEQLA